MSEQDKKLRCTYCKKQKVCKEFYRHLYTRSGYTTKCKVCSSLHGRQYRQANKRKLREYDRSKWLVNRDDPRYLRNVRKAQRRWVINNRAKLRVKNRKWKKLNPLKAAAHVAVKDALRSGKIKRHRCVVCKSTRTLEGHHANYRRPLDVVWYCRKHHRRLHAGRL